jgi:hypothetical protein
MTSKHFLVWRRRTRCEARREIPARCETSHDILSFKHGPITVFCLDIINNFLSPWSTMNDGTILKTWCNDGTMMKQRWQDGEITLMQWHDGENNIAFSSSCRRSFIIVPSYFHHLTITCLPLAFVVSSLYNRCFTFVSSCFNHHTIAFASSYHRAIALSPLYHG